MTTTTMSPRVAVLAGRAALQKAARYVNAANKNAVAGAERLREKSTSSGQAHAPSHGPAAAPVYSSLQPSIQSVMDCIKRYESGDYTEQSHIYDGSGAYQYIPSTWQAWSARAGHPGWQYAYQAPPWVQDAVTAYALTNGGAGNWSMRYGNDPCTSGLAGGG